VTYLAISLGAILGANTRFILGGWVAERVGSSFPFGTLVINVSGSFLVGVVLALSLDRLVPSWFRPFFAIGFLGSYTTFSTFSYETLALARDGALLQAGLNVAGSVALALVGVYLGAAAARML
jgi:CrcB protein